MRQLSTLILALAATILLGSACSKKEEAAGDKKASVKMSQHECEIQLGRKPAPPFTGQASSELEADAKEAAWKDVCAKLPAADQVNCRDPKKYSASTGIGGGQVNDKTTYTVTITLQPVATMVSGKGQSDKDEDSACKAATENACKNAGATGDCVASGEWVQGGRSTSSTTMSIP